MADFKVQVTKRLTFQGRIEEFSNVYTYRFGLADPNFTMLANAIVDAEKLIHSSVVTFVRTQIWDVGVPPNLMRLSREETGLGQQAAAQGFYRECALLIKWPLPRSEATTRSRQRSLKKWLRTQAHASTAQLTGDTPLGPLSGFSSLQTYVNSVTTVLNGDGQLISESGAVPNGPPVLHPYLEHRQFPRGRKEAA